MSSYLNKHSNSTSIPSSETKQYNLEIINKSNEDKNILSRYIKLNNSTVLKNLENLSRKGSFGKRVDKFGNLIGKKNKIHKISFADQFPGEENKLTQINNVSSFKNFNSKKYKNERCCNACLIF